MSVGAPRNSSSTQRTLNTPATTQTQSLQNGAPAAAPGTAATGNAAASTGVSSPRPDAATREGALARATNDMTASRLQGRLQSSNVPAGLTPVQNAPTSVVTAAPPDLHVQVPHYSQFEGKRGYTPGDTACFKAAVAMARAAGATVGDASERIQVGKTENKTGQLTVDKEAAARGNAYIDEQLAAGKPVVVGVSHKDDKYNVDKLTDHFVVITGKGTDEQGRAYYTFHDPGVGTGNKAAGADTNVNNRFYPDENGKLVRDGALARGFVTDRRYEVSMVRINQ